MSSTLVGSWKHESTAAFEEFLLATGVPYMYRKALIADPPQVVFSYDEELDVWTRVEKNASITNVAAYTLGQRYQYSRVDGRVLSVLAAAEGADRHVHTSFQEGTHGEDATVTWEATSDGRMTASHRVAGITATRTFKRAQ